MTDKRWKKTERRVAEFLGGERVPITGRFRGSAPDVKHPLFSIEVKDRQTLPDWLLDAMEQAQESRRGEQIPIVILHQKGQSVADCLTLLKLSDIMELYKRLEAKNDIE